MRVCSLASSSKGNSTVVYTDDNKVLLIDMGITLKDLEEKFQKLKLDPGDIIGVLVSHEHGDHTKGLTSLYKKYGIPIYCHYNSVDGVMVKTKLHRDAFVRFSTVNFEIEDFKIEPFEVSHDVFCVGYNIYEGNGKISIVTDLGYTTNAVVEKLYNSRLVILEANHDEKMLVASTKYPAMLKNRILSNKGHLSNTNSAKVVASLAQHNVKQILFAHLSEETNTPSKCYETICNYLNSVGVSPQVNIKLDIAKPYGVGPIYVIK